MKKFNKTFLWLGFSALLTLLLINQSIYAYALLNVALVKHNLGFVDFSLYKRVLQQGGNLPSILWRTALVMAESGDAKTAAQTLLEIPNLESLTEDQFQMVLPILVDAGMENEGLTFFEQLPIPFSLDPQIASLVLLNYKYLQVPLAEERFKLLLARAFALTDNAIVLKLLSTEVVDKNFWASPIGEMLAETLEWRSQQVRFTSIQDGNKKTLEIDMASTVERLRQLIGTPNANLSIGDELIDNGNFENAFCYPVILMPDFPPRYCSLHHWLPSFMVAGRIWNEAIFAIGTDNKIQSSGSYSIRINGLILDRRPGLDPARAGIWYESPVSVRPNLPYLISFSYRTQLVDSVAASLWVSNEPSVFFGGDIPLPSTDGKWHHAYIIAWNRMAQDGEIRPLLRSFSKGYVWFDNFSIRPIYSDRFVEPQDPKILIIDDKIKSEKVSL